MGELWVNIVMAVVVGKKTHKMKEYQVEQTGSSCRGLEKLCFFFTGFLLLTVFRFALK